MGRDAIRKAQLNSDSFIRIAEKNKLSIINASLALYVGLYLILGVGGISFQTQPALTYVTDTGAKNSGCATGSLWVEQERLHWCGGSNEYYFEYDGHGDESRTTGVAGSNGALWIEGSDVCFVNANSDKICLTAHDTGSNPGGASGSVWLESNVVHYIDANGNERVVCEQSDSPVDTSLCP